MLNKNQEKYDHTCDHCGESLAAEGRLLANQILCDDCYVEKITAHKPHRTSYPSDPFGYIRRLKENEPIHPQKFH